MRDILFHGRHPNLKYQFRQDRDPKGQSKPRHTQQSFHHNIEHILENDDAQIRI